MSTIPSTLDAYKPTYTVIGGLRTRTSAEAFPVSVLVLNRGPQVYRSAFLSELTHIGFDSILSLETGQDSVELETIASRFPQVRFATFRDAVSVGDMLNVGMREASTPYVFVVWNDMRLATSTLSSRFFEKVAELDLACLAPWLHDQAGDVLPVSSHPAVARRSLKVLSLEPKKDGEKSLYPFDWCGIYSKEKFTLLGGFDHTIAEPYWQLVDFGTRAWLWGERIHLAQALKLNYQGRPPVEDRTPGAGYGRYWLKNVAPVFAEDCAAMHRGAAFRYLLHARSGPVAGIAEYRAARDWVRLNSFRFRQDASRLADLWDPL